MKISTFQTALAASFALLATIAAAQAPIHFQQGADLPPGTVGRQQLERGGPLRGYFQPVEIRAPQGSMIAVAVSGAFDDPQPAPRKVGLLIGAVYRIQVTRIPLYEGREVYPTIELVNRLYPPPGEAERHPVVLDLDQEDLELAMRGKYITRVIYLEDPRSAMPIADGPRVAQRYFEVLSHEDPLKVADELGRPMAILRIGSRLPDANGPTDKYLYGSPPLVMLPQFTPGPTPSDASPFPGGGPIAPPPTVPGVRRPQSDWMKYVRQPAGGTQREALPVGYDRSPANGSARDVAQATHWSRPEFAPARPAFNPLRPNERPLKEFPAMLRDDTRGRADACHWWIIHEWQLAALCRWGHLAVTFAGALLLCSCQSIPDSRLAALAPPNDLLRQRPVAEQGPPQNERWTNPARMQPPQYAGGPQFPVQQAGYFPEGRPYAAGWGHHFVGPGGMLPQAPPLAYGASGPECHWLGDPAAINNPEAIPGDQPWSPPGLARPWPYDEYICDGGDRRLGVQVEKDWTVHGLEEEDTVVHFDTLDGRTLVTESNKVCLYAPRFASVRQVSASVQSDAWDNIAGSNHDLKLNLHEERLAANTKVRQVQPIGDVGTKGPGALIEKLPPLSVDNLQRLAAFQNALKPFEDFQVMRTGELIAGEAPRLAEAIVAAETWTIKQGAQAIVDKAEVIIQDHFAKPQETRLVEEPPARPKMCITKIASQKDALPGEIVEFTLRFDNVGNQVTGNVTILDSLTPRLEYVPDSAQCSVGAKFYTQENAGESLILRWEISEPIEKGQGGIIRFKCRVR